MANEDPGHLALLRSLRCAIGKGCSGLIRAHHSTRHRGMSQKSHDHDAMPLCEQHHVDFHGATGYFKPWTEAQRAEWQDAMSALYRPKPYDPDVF